MVASQHVCPECGTSFLGIKSAVFCGQRCQKRSVRRRHEQRRTSRPHLPITKAQELIQDLHVDQRARERMAHAKTG